MLTTRGVFSSHVSKSSETFHYSPTAMSPASHKTSDVFGITREIPLNYVTRSDVDTVFQDSLQRDKHVVVYGGSKQGKTCLRKRCMPPETYVTVQCSNNWELADVHSAILKAVGYEVALSTTRATTGKNKLNAKVSSSFFGLGGEVGAETEEEREQTAVSAPLELDPDDVNDVILALKKIGFTKRIVLEDFHYLPTDTQRAFAFALKAFHESSKLTFVIVGVWLEENRLIVYNGDMTGRVLAINADGWVDEALDEVITEGERLLNVTFSDAFRGALIKGVLQSVYIVQEVCYRACKMRGIEETCRDPRQIGDDIDVGLLIREVVSEQSGRYNSFLTQFADGFQDTELQMYRWLLYPVLLASQEDLEEGLRFARIRKAISSKHTRGTGLNPGNLTQALQSASSLQVKKSIRPLILDYDFTNLRLNVVDKGFTVWLAYQDRPELLDTLGLPSDVLSLPQ